MRAADGMRLVCESREKRVRERVAYVEIAPAPGSANVGRRENGGGLAWILACI